MMMMFCRTSPKISIMKKVPLRTSTSFDPSQEIPRERSKTNVVNFAENVHFTMTRSDSRGEADEDHDWCEDR